MNAPQIRILVTGGAGFIGAALCMRLVRQPNLLITSIDNINDYYDVSIKYGRLSILGVDESRIEWNVPVESSEFPNLRFIRMNLEDSQRIDELFKENKFDIVVNLAAQAGVRYSIDHPRKYIESNIDGFINVLEGCRQNKVSHLVYASSSSVYGLNGKTPFSESDGVGHPVSLYAATKRSNELMAHAYSQLYGLPATGLRFFTVYGPWGRPDMSPYLFVDAILDNRPIKVFNNGDMWRDFTYIDDVVEGIARVLHIIPKGREDWDSKNPDPSSSPAPFRIYNIGNSSPVKLLDYITAIEKAIGRKALKDFLPMQPGDVYQTFADSTALADVTGFRPSTPLSEGIGKTVEWMRQRKSKQ